MVTLQSSLLFAKAAVARQLGGFQEVEGSQLLCIRQKNRATIKMVRAASTNSSTMMHNNRKGLKEWVCAERSDGVELQGPSKPVKGSLLSEDTWKLAEKPAHEIAQTPSRFPYADRCIPVLRLRIW